MRKNRDRIFGDFQTDSAQVINNKFEIENQYETVHDELEQVSDSNLYGMVIKLLNDEKLQNYVEEGDVEAFIDYLRTTKVLPNSILITNEGPDVYRDCDNNWCVNTHVIGWTEFGIAIAAVFAIIAGIIGTLKVNEDEKSILGVSVELAAVMGNANFAEKVNESLQNWVKVSLAPASLEGEFV